MSKRTYQDKFKIQWHDGWMEKLDGQGERLKSWASRQSQTEGKCNYCKVIFRFDNLGAGAFLHGKAC